MIQFFLWFFLILVLAGILGREFLRLQEARREKKDSSKDSKDSKRFWRRAKGVFVLFLIFATIQLGSFIEPYLTPRQILIYYLNCFIELIWLLILVAREFTDITTSYISLRNEVTIDTLKEIQREVTANRDPDDQPIPSLDFNSSKNDS